MLVVYQTITERLAWQPDACNLLALSPTVNSPHVYSKNSVLTHKQLHGVVRRCMFPNTVRGTLTALPGLIQIDFKLDVYPDNCSKMDTVSLCYLNQMIRLVRSSLHV